MIERFGLYLVLSDPATSYETCAEAAVSEGVRYVQLRMKGVPRDDALRVGRRLRRLTLGTSTRFIVNDDVTIAREVDADGVHLGQNDIPIGEARAAWPAPGKLFGLSTHNARQARDAETMRPDYIGVGPVYRTPTKAVPDPTLGLDAMGRIVRACPLATVAIGGITSANLPETLTAGAINFAVVRDVCQSAHPRSAIAELMRIWRSASPEH